MNLPDKRFSLGVILCVFNEDFSKIFLLKRNAEKRARRGLDWGNVGGMLELDETVKEGCAREAKEEIEVIFDPEKIKLLDINESPFFNPTCHAVWFVCFTTMDEKEQIVLNSESEEYGWFDLQKLPEKTLDSKEDLIRFRALAKKVSKA